jgi:Uma2 family endonuclease
MRSPHAAWIRKEQWDSLTDEQREGFLPFAPDFVIELIERRDNFSFAEKKMKEWIANGCRLAWLIDPFNAKAYIYRGDGSTGIVESFAESLSGEDVLPGFVFPLSELNEV